MKLKTRIAVGAALAAAIGFGAFMLFRPSTSSGSAGLDRLSNHGIVVTGVKATGFGVRAAYLLGERNGHDFYRLATSSDGICYGVGNAKDAGFISCIHGTFPTASYPILVSTLAGSTSPGASRSALHASSVEGFAADGIASIDILDSDSKNVGGGPITGNIFSFAVSTTAAGMTIIARDAAGAVVWSQHQ
jgi:hypothetical protein